MSIFGPGVQVTLTTDHTLFIDFPLMRFFFISPDSSKISSLHTGIETVSELKLSPNVLYFYTFKVILFPYIHLVHHVS